MAAAYCVHIVFCDDDSGNRRWQNSQEGEKMGCFQFVSAIVGQGLCMFISVVLLFL